MNSRFLCLSISVASACGASPTTATSPAATSPASPVATGGEYPDCRAAAIEPDLKRTPTQVADAASPPTGDVWISTTYLALTPDPKGQAIFRSLMTDMIRVLPSTPGLVSFRFATSEACLSARTLAVWRDEESLEAFVRSQEHHAAMRQTNTLSRGSSTFTRWLGPIQSAEWARAAQELATQDGPYQ